MVKELKSNQEIDHQFIKELKRQLDYAKSKINTLEARLTSLCLDFKDKALVLNVLPEDDSSSLLSKVHDLLSRLFPRLHQSDIDLVYRSGYYQATGPPRPVCVTFIRASDKRAIFDKRDSLREDPSVKSICVNEDIPVELRGPHADMRALAKFATDAGQQPKLLLIN